MESPYKFVQEPDQDLICQICHKIADDPQKESNSGKILVWKEKMIKKCPCCRRRPKYIEAQRVSYLDTQIVLVALLKCKQN